MSSFANMPGLFKQKILKTSEQSFVGCSSPMLDPHRFRTAQRVPSALGRVHAYLQPAMPARIKSYFSLQEIKCNSRLPCKFLKAHDPPTDH
jgi:hypothetical protein